MEKKRVIQAIESAIESHRRQLKTSRLMAYGMKLNAEDAALQENQCLFGGWLYDNEKWLKRLFGIPAIDEIEKLHTMWHNENRKIYALYDKGRKRGILGRVFSSGSITEADMDRAKAYYADMQKISADLEKRMKLLLKRATSMPQSEYETIGG
jgi:hypothetical protein